MKQLCLILLISAGMGVAIAQAPAKPATRTATTAKPSATATKATAASPATQLPPGVPPARALVKTAFTLRYQDIMVGTGTEAEPGQVYKVHYTGWLAADGRKFDSSYDHRSPVMDKDGKPVLGDDGKPKMGDAQPFSFPQGYGRLIPAFDQGVGGMKIGGKQRIFIPWQLAYGAKGRPGPDAEHPGIPAKADLIFDVVLLDVTALQMPANHPPMGGLPPGHPMPPGMMPHPGTSAPSTPPADHGAAPSSPSSAPATAPAQPTAPQQPK